MMSQYQQYRKLYRLLRYGQDQYVLWEFANEFGMLTAYDKALTSYRARNFKMPSLETRLWAYKQRKMYGTLAYAA